MQVGILITRNNAHILSDVLSETRNNTFRSISDHSKQCHILDQNLRDDHISIIIKGVIKKYLVIFYHQFGPVFIEGEHHHPSGEFMRPRHSVPVFCVDFEFGC